VTTGPGTPGLHHGAYRARRQARRSRSMTSPIRRPV